jgi:hypothetical protein
MHKNYKQKQTTIQTAAAATTTTINQVLSEQLHFIPQFYITLLRKHMSIEQPRLF